MGQWTNAIRDIVNSNFNTSIGAESSPYWIKPEIWKATPYVRTRYDSTIDALVPEYRTTPGWSGANQIPLNVEGMGDTIVVNFVPIGANMTCQLCYRAEDGTPVYSKPVSDGNCVLFLDKKPANNVVIAVITNTDYIYEGEETRKAHFDYRLQLVKGIYKKASVYKKWYNYESVITDVEDPIWWEEESSSLLETGFARPDIEVFPNPVKTNREVYVKFSDGVKGNKQITIINLQGQILFTQVTGKSEITLNLDNPDFNNGIYFVVVVSENQHFVERVVIQE